MDQKKEFSESTTPSLPSFDANIPAIYFVANNPLSMYKLMRGNYFISLHLSGFPTQTLIDEFNKRTKVPVNNSAEIAEIYAILIALTFKSRNEVESFFKEVGKIDFEWFSKIAEIYLSDVNPMPQYEASQIVTWGFKTNIIDSTINVQEPKIEYIK